MKSTFLYAAILLCASGLAAGVAHAQDTPAPPPSGQQGGRGMMDPARQLEMMKTQLGLSDDQAAKIKVILDDQGTKMQALRADTSTSMEDKRPKMEAIRADVKTKIEAILTDDQKTKYEAMSQRRPGGGPPPQL